MGSEPPFVQSGCAKAWQPRHCEHQPFLSPEEFTERMESADLVISHVGIGTIRQAVRLGKALVAVPRLKRYGEVVNDHQLELLKAMADQGLVIPVYDLDDLPKAVAKAERSGPARWPRSPMLDLVRQAIGDVLGPPPGGWR
ncbi:MAG: glycosyltransferase [Planctomycetota bacterium]|nr:glycosyltransferase [Planctomycetota bacterium]